MGNFKKLRVWQLSKNLAVKIYQVTDEHTKFKQDFRFRDQIRAAAVSVPSNTAEGDELDTNKQSIRHFYIAKGSTAEVITQLIIAQEIGYLPPKITEELIKEYEHVSHMLAKLITARSKTP
ncbi:four helix bundle protein [Phaeodactylibacter luteus]|uniref:Four helix bundle protein n=1 Tax=Phaeodactylibacter luteus TaxID=1564516 RepID=A0A5C6RNF1_9BACT|nr:four helix bundle protein [Phaeodactylibacter luteus]